MALFYYLGSGHSHIKKDYIKNDNKKDPVLIQTVKVCLIKYCN